MDETDATRPPSTWLASLLVGSSVAVLGLITLGKKSFWYDEAFDGVAHQRDGRQRAPPDHGDGDEPGGIPRLPQGMGPSCAANDETSGCGSRPWWPRRWPSRWSCRSGLGCADRNTGVVAGLLLATHELVVRWSQQARTYALVTLAVVLVALVVRPGAGRSTPPQLAPVRLRRRSLRVLPLLRGLCRRRAFRQLALCTEASAAQIHRRVRGCVRGRHLPRVVLHGHRATIADQLHPRAVHCAVAARHGVDDRTQFPARGGRPGRHRCLSVAATARRPRCYAGSSCCSPVGSCCRSCCL